MYKVLVLAACFAFTTAISFDETTNKLKLTGTEPKATDAAKVGQAEKKETASTKEKSGTTKRVGRIRRHPGKKPKEVG